MGTLADWANYSSESERSSLDVDLADLRDVTNADAYEALDELFDSDDSIERDESQSLLEFLTERFDENFGHYNYDPYSGENIDRERLRTDVNYVREMTRRFGRAVTEQRDEGTPLVRGIVNNILREVPPLGRGGFQTILKVAGTLCFAATNFPQVIVAESLSFIFTSFAGPKIQFALSLALLALQGNEGKNNAVAAATLKLKNVLRAPLGAGRSSSASVRGGSVCPKWCSCRLLSSSKL